MKAILAPKADYLEVELCDCGCGGVLLKHCLDDKKVLSFGSMTPEDAEAIALQLSVDAMRARVMSGQKVVQGELHNRLAPELLSRLVRPVLESGGTPTDVLILGESVIAGVIHYVAKMGGDEPVLDVVMSRVRERLAEMRLGNVTPAGSA